MAQQLEQLHRKELALAKVREELEQLKAQKVKQLEGIADLNAAAAKEQLLEALEDETRTNA